MLISIRIILMKPLRIVISNDKFSKSIFKYDNLRRISSTLINHNKLKEQFAENTSSSNKNSSINKCNESSDSKIKKNQLPLKIRLKQAVRDYGSTVIIFHTGISLTSLGIAYLAVSSGVDVVWILTKLGASESVVSSSLATGASTFVMAYALHKVFAPARILCTLTCVPIIVHKLRKIGFLRTPVAK